MAKGSKVRVVDLGNIDLELLTKGRYQIEEVHRVDVELLAQVGIRIEPRRIDLGSDPAEFINKNPLGGSTIRSILFSAFGP